MSLELNYYCLTAGDKRPQYRLVAKRCNALNGVNRRRLKPKNETEAKASMADWMAQPRDFCPNCGSHRLRSAHLWL